MIIDNKKLTSFTQLEKGDEIYPVSPNSVLGYSIGGKVARSTEGSLHIASGDAFGKGEISQMIIFRRVGNDLEILAGEGPFRFLKEGEIPNYSFLRDNKPDQSAQTPYRRIDAIEPGYSEIGD